MNQRFAKDVYRQSGTNDSPMKHSVAEGRSREEGSKLVWNWGCISRLCEFFIG